MELVQIKLKLMIDILNQKNEILKQILSICENQEFLLNEIHPMQRLDITKEMLKEKQKLVDEILKLDKHFNSTSDSIKDYYENIAEVNETKNLIIEIQNLIKVVMDLDIKIRYQESINTELLNKHINKKSQVTLTSKNDLLNKYKKNSK